MFTDPRAPPNAALRFDDQTITIVIGPDKEKLLLHRSHAQTSTFLAAAFKKEWIGDAKEMELLYEDAGMVRNYLYYLYTGKIPIKTSNVYCPELDRVHEEEERILAELYVLGERYNDTGFKNTVINAILAKTLMVINDEDRGFFPSGPNVDIIYSGTCAGSPAPQLMIDMHMRSGNGEWITQHPAEEHNKEFLMELCAKMLDKRWNARGKEQSFDLQQACNYHEHDKDEKCSFGA